MAIDSLAHESGGAIGRLACGIVGEVFHLFGNAVAEVSLAYWRYITERKPAEKALRRAEEQFRMIFEETSIGCTPLCDEIDECLGFRCKGDGLRESGTEIVHAEGFLVRTGGNYSERQNSRVALCLTVADAYALHRLSHR